ncbi:unnamed protein product [Caenorhabditis angaria]|uniref:Tr-type G domain-containing protein n=1 Tax=Caenorhabditis angaria TaxID=860376 RepID=A0A9P1MXF2_9PELO|nr:unnamed protein product [Caenorhabditis angaria]
MCSLNVGILGHVDCGKTTFTKRFAEIASTSAFDKHSDGGGRRNTLDLGFSSVMISGRRLALVDCPGHAALIRAVLAASTVFDMAILLIDARNGIQAQTAEHMLLCKIFCPEKVIVILNKVDLLEEKEVSLEKTKKSVRKSLKLMGILESSPILEMSLDDQHFCEEYMENLRKTIEMLIENFEPPRNTKDPLLIAVDHCFSIKGKGTVLTGTITQGTLKIGEEIEFANLKEVRKVKSIESWKTSRDKIETGERAAILVTNFEAARFSRAIVAVPGYLKPMKECLCDVEPIQFFRSSLSSRTKMHISIGYETVMAECQFLRKSGISNSGEDEFQQLDKMEMPCQVWLIFEKPVFVNSDFLMASRLDQNGKGCRFAFRGFVRKILEPNGKLIRFTRKHRTGFIDRLEQNSNSAICAGMFKGETNFSIFQNMQILIAENPGDFWDNRRRFWKIRKISGQFQRRV